MSATITVDELTLLTDDASDRASDAARGYHYMVSADGTQWRSAEQVITSVQSQLFDGEAIAAGSYANMTATLFVAVVAENSAYLATGCAELMRVLRRPGMRELVYLAPDGASPATVFDVLHATPALHVDLESLDEVENVRTYELALTCKPFPRSDTEIVTAGASVGAPTFTLIDDAGTASEWTAFDTWVGARSWTPLRYNVMPNPLTSSSYRTQGWFAGANALSISWDTGSSGSIASPAAMVITGKPTSSTQRVHCNSPYAVLTGTGAVRLRLVMGSAFVCTFGVLYRWFNASNKQVGGDNTIPEVTRTAPTHTLSALLTPPAGATKLVIYPYTRFGNSTGGVRTYTVREVFVGNDGASFTGDTPDTATNAYDWTGLPYSSPQVELGPASMVASSGEVSVTAYRHPWSDYAPVFTWNQPWVTTESAPFLVVSGKVTGAPAAVEIYGIAGLSWLAPSMVAAAADGTFKAYFNVGARSESNLRVRTIRSGFSNDPATTPTLSVTQIDRATSLPAIGTGRQGKFSIDVQGTMPAEASLQVANTGGVGRNVLIYTGPANPDFTPALSPHLVAAGTPDATTISNKKFAVPTSTPGAETWTIPHPGLVDSTYAVFAKLSATGLTNGAAYTFSIAQHTSPDAGIGYYGDTSTSTAKVIATATTFSGFAQIGTLRLPTVNQDGAATGIEGLKLWVSGGAWTLDEAWLFDMVNGSLSHVLMPSVTYPNVTIKAASPDHPQQRYLVENVWDLGSVRDLGRSAQIRSNHRLDPAKGCDVFAICDAASPDLSVNASYYPRWDVFAAPIPGLDAEGA